MAKKLPAAPAPNVSSLKKPRAASRENKPGRFDGTSAARDLAVRAAEAGILDALTVDEALDALEVTVRTKLLSPRGQGRRGERGIPLHAELRTTIHRAERRLAAADDRAVTVAGFIREAVTIYLAVMRSLTVDDSAMIARWVAPLDKDEVAVADDVLEVARIIGPDIDIWQRRVRTLDARRATVSGRGASVSVTFSPALDGAVKDFVAVEGKAVGIRSMAGLVREAAEIYAEYVTENDGVRGSE